MGLACAVVFVAGMIAAITVAPGDASAIEDVGVGGGTTGVGKATTPGAQAEAAPGVTNEGVSSPLPTVAGDIDTRRSASAVEVQAREWPEPVTAGEPWAALIRGAATASS